MLVLNILWVTSVVTSLTMHGP